jgi:uncharacterized protein involved in exopolysaccharide biosynthesis
VALEENPLLNRIEADLVSANVGLQDLLARYTEQDRRVREKREQIALIKRQLATAKSSLMQSRSKQSGLIGKQIGDTRAQLVYLRERKVDGERLARVVALARDAFLLYGKKLEEARIAAQLSRDQLSNLAVVERPHATSWTDFDERIGTVLLAAIVGLTIGIAVAFAGALFNKSLRTRRDVEIHVGLPVLATIPDLRFAAIPDLRGNPS